MEYADTPAHTSEMGLRDYAAVLWRRRGIFSVVVALSLAATAVLTVRMTPQYRAVARLRIRDPLSAAPSRTAQQTVATETPDTQLELLRSDNMAYVTYNWLRDDAEAGGSARRDVPAASDRARFAREVADSVKYANPENTNLITVASTGRTAREAAALANAICDAFVDWKNRLASGQTDQRADELGRMLDAARVRKAAAERRLTAFKQARRMPDPTARQQEILARSQRLDYDAASLRDERIPALETRVRDLGDRLSRMRAAARSGRVTDGYALPDLNLQISRLERERALLARRFNPEYPDMKALDAQLEDLQGRRREALREAADTSRPSLESLALVSDQAESAHRELAEAQYRLAAVERERQELRVARAALPALEQQYAQLAADAEGKTQIFQQLQGQYDDAQIRYQRARSLASLGNAQVAARALPPDTPFQPDPVRNGVIGGGLGLALALLAALWGEQADHRIRTVRDLKRIVAGPVVGALPSMTADEVRGVLAGTTPEPIRQRYGLALANLALSVWDGEPQEGLHDALDGQLILVTSAVSGEGKSTIAAEIAHTLARAGRSVVLVDADMRRAARGRPPGMAAAVGLADTLLDRVPAERALVSSGTERLRMLHSGVTETDAAELLSGPRLKKVLDRLRTQASVVIVDAPACAVFADALLIAPHADCILHVVGLGMADDDAVRDAARALRGASPGHLLFLVNRGPRERRHGRGDGSPRRRIAGAPPRAGAPRAVGPGDHSDRGQAVTHGR